MKDVGVLVMISAARVLAIDVSTQCDVLTLVMMNRDCTQTTSVVNVVYATLNVSTAVMARCSTFLLTIEYFHVNLMRYIYCKVGLVVVSHTNDFHDIVSRQCDKNHTGLENLCCSDYGCS
jgi:hypothetical protein